MEMSLSGRDGVSHPVPYMETLMMSRDERKRMTIMIGVKRQELTQVQAAQLLGLGYRQIKRVWRRYQAEGDAGLVHRLRGQPGLRHKPPNLRRQVLARAAEERYADFGPTLLAEELAKEGLVVDHDTVRRWLLAAGQRTVRRRRQKHRQWRERKPCFGALVQLDGSHHDWFEGRRAKCVLMVMVDDATNRLRARFFEQETTRASYEVFAGWVARHGLPGGLYVDRDSIYRCEGAPSVADQLAGREPQTQFGRAMAQLGVELILANSPQAKGRVERMNGVLQDRLVKALRLAGINDLARANQFLDETYLREFQGRFTRVAASALDVHRKVPRNLNEVLSWEEERVVQHDWTVACDGHWYQLDRQHEALSLVGRKVVVRTLRDGRVQLAYRGGKLKWRTLPARPPATPRLPAPRSGRSAVPGPDHPWRRWRGSRNGQPGGARAGGGALPPAPPPARAEGNDPATTSGKKERPGKRGHF